MADIVVGDITARLRLDTRELTQGLAQAQQALAKFQQAGGSQQVSDATRRAMQETAQAVRQVAQESAQQARRAYQETALAARQAAQETTLLARRAAQHTALAAREAAQTSSQTFRRETQERALAGQQATQATRQQFQSSAQDARQAAQQSTQAARSAYQHTAIAAREAAQQSSQAFRSAYQHTALAAQQAAKQASQAFQQQMQEAQQVAQAARQASQTSGSGLANVLQIAGGIGVATSLAGIVTALKNVALETVQVGARFEQLRVSLAAIAGGSANGARQFQFIVETSQRLGQALEPMARGWRTLTAAASQTSLALADQQRLMTALATEGRRVGASSEEMQRGIVAVAQAASKGTLSMEELRGQLGEAIPTALAATAKGMGLTTEALIKLVSTGNVGFVPFAQAITRGLEQIQAGSKGMGETASNAFTRMMTEFTLLADAIMQSGLAGYLKTVSDNVREAVRFTRETFFPPPHTAPVGPTVQELGVTPDQQRQLMRLDAAIARAQQHTELSRRAIAGMRPGEDDAARLHERLDVHERTLRVLQEQRTQLLEGAKAMQSQADAQAQVDQAANKTTDTVARQAEFASEFAKRQEDIAKAEQEFREQAARAPQRLGAPTGTPEQVQEYNRHLQQSLTKQVEALDSLVQRKAVDIQLTKEQREALARYDVQYGQLTQNIEASREAEQQRHKASREAEQQRLQAAREAQRQAEQAISQELQLRAQLEQVQAVIARPEERPAERARTQELQRFVAAQRTIDQALKQFADNPALRALAPAMQQQFEAAKAALPGAQEVAGLQAFNAAMVQHVMAPLEQLAGTYELTKQKRDADTASQLAAMAVGTPYEASARQLAETVRQIGEAQSQARLDRLGQSVQEVIDKLNLAGRSPLEQELGAIRQQFVALDGQLIETAQKLDQAWESATPDQRLQIAAQLNEISAAWAGLGAARDTALQERITAPERDTIRALRNQLAQMQAVPEERQGLRARQRIARGDIMTAQGRVETEELAAAIEAQERLNDSVGLFVQLSQAVEQAWGGLLQRLFEPAPDNTERLLQMTSVTEKLADAQQRLADLRLSQARVERERLSSGAQEQMREALADQEKAVSVLDSQRRALEGVEAGTNRVALAFKAMAQSILQSMGQIASQEAFRALTQLGLGLLTGAFAPTMGRHTAGGGIFQAPASGAIPATPPLIAFQHGGMVRRPTLALLGENPAHNPETVLNRQQMASMMQGGGRGGGAGGDRGISIINVASRQQAEQTAQEQRALGRTAVINYVNENLSLGESSSILRNLRSLQR